MSFPINFFIFVILPAALLIWLQVFLSRAASRWPGLILPALHLLLAIVISVGNVAYTSNIDTKAFVEQVYESSYVEGEAGEPEIDGASIGTIGGSDGPTSIFVTRGMNEFFMIFWVFLLCNIPTAVDLAIYGAVRRKRRKHADVDKSRIQDL